MTNGTFQAGGPFLSEIAFGLYEGHPLKEGKAKRPLFFMSSLKKRSRERIGFALTLVKMCNCAYFLDTILAKSYNFQKKR